jgi:ABC-2 type transport system permease protein
MGRLISAEFRKILTTKMWWALLIPTVALAALWSTAGNGLVGLLLDSFNRSTVAGELRVNINDLPWSTLIFARTVNISALFPIVFGALALSGEINRRTITTSYLTAPNRGSLLGAKLITYAVVGFAFGVVITGVASIGTLIVSHPQQLPDAMSWLELAGAGILECMLWTLLAMGVGALFGNPIGAIISLLLYTLLVENLIGLVLPGHWPGVLINGSADGLTGSIAAQTFVDKVSTISPYFNQELQNDALTFLRGLAGAQGAYDWWISALIFAGWTAVFAVGGWFMSRQRDIT